MVVTICGAIAWYVRTMVKDTRQEISSENQRCNAELEQRITTKLEDRERSATALENRITEKLEQRESKIIAKLEELRRDFSNGFMPAPLATEQQKGIVFRLENVEKELSGVRDRAHANSQTLTQIGFQVGEIRALADQVPSLAERMADKARRLASAEAVIKSNSDALADHSNRLHDLERNRQ